MSDTPRTDCNIRGYAAGEIPSPILEFARQLERDLAVAKELLPQSQHDARGGMQTDWWSVAMKLRRDLAAAKLVIEQKVALLASCEIALAEAHGKEAAATKRADEAEAKADLLHRVIKCIMEIPNMTDEQLAQLQQNCKEAMRNG